MVRDIQMNQAEPELQSEELHKIRAAIDMAHRQYDQLYSKYVSLFDFSPIGFLVIDEDGLIQELNLVASTLFNTSQGRLIGRRITDFIHHDDQDLFYQRKLSCLKKMETSAFELKMRNVADQFMDARLQLSPIKDHHSEKTYYSVALTDISELVHLSSSANLQQCCLELANTTENHASLLIGHVQLIKSYLDCDAVGIRMKDTDGGMPYLAYEGVSRECIESASRDCPKSDACLCAMVIRGATDPGQPFFTATGSFYMNSKQRFLAIATTPEMASCKSDCPAFNYGSMAMIPIAVDNTRWGVLHLADHRENQFPLRVIEALESVTSRLGLAIHRLNLQEHLLQSQKDLDDLSRHLLTIQEEEQRRIALDLHDGCGQNLNVLKLRLQFLQKQLPSEAADVSDQCNALISLTDSILHEIRAIAHGLKPAVLETLGLVPAIRQLLRSLRDQYEVYIETHIDVLGEIGDPTVQVCLYRIFQEALNNIIKHAQATWVLFNVRRNIGTLCIVITDNGIGFDSQHLCKGPDDTNGMGMQAMALRCRMIGADMTINSRKGKGTRLTICLPTPERTASQ